MTEATAVSRCRYTFPRHPDTLCFCFCFQAAHTSVKLGKSGLGLKIPLTCLGLPSKQAIPTICFYIDKNIMGQ